MFKKVVVAVGVLTPPAAFAWHLGEKVHTLKFFLEVPHDPTINSALAVVPSGPVTTLIAVLALLVGVAAFIRSSANGRKAQSQVIAKRSSGVKVIEEHEETHTRRTVKSVTDLDS